MQRRGRLWVGKMHTSGGSAALAAACTAASSSSGVASSMPGGLGPCARPPDIPSARRGLVPVPPPPVPRTTPPGCSGSSRSCCRRRRCRRRRCRCYRCACMALLRAVGCAAGRSEVRVGVVRGQPGRAEPADVRPARRASAATWMLDSVYLLLWAYGACMDCNCWLTPCGGKRCCVCMRAHHCETSRWAQRWLGQASSK